jgi:hypothetical protein
MITIATRVPEEDLKQFRARCEENISTPAQMIRHLIKMYLANNPNANTHP